MVLRTCLALKAVRRRKKEARSRAGSPGADAFKTSCVTSKHMLLTLGMWQVPTGDAWLSARPPELRRPVPMPPEAPAPLPGPKLSPIPSLLPQIWRCNAAPSSYSQTQVEGSTRYAKLWAATRALTRTYSTKVRAGTTTCPWLSPLEL